MWVEAGSYLKMQEFLREFSPTSGVEALRPDGQNKEFFIFLFTARHTR